MKCALVLQPRVRQDIQARTDRILRELGNPEPPLRLEDVRTLLRLDRDYFSGDSDGLLQAMVSKLRRGGIQFLEHPTLLVDAVKKFDLRALDRTGQVAPGNGRAGVVCSASPANPRRHELFDFYPTEW